MSADENHGGIPTRAIHEAYLDVQRALSEYRQATDRGDSGAVDRYHGELQNAVLTFWELLRPHVRSNAAVSEYWDGEPPSYNGETPPDPADGTAVLNVQTHRRTADVNAIDVPENGQLRAWHDALDAGEDVRLAGVQVGGGSVLAKVEYYELGLRRLDTWGTKIIERSDSIGGFLGATNTKTAERQRVDVDKLQRAARELSDVAEQLGALSEFDSSVPRTEITDELIEEVDEWRKQQNLD